MLPAQYDQGDFPKGSGAFGAQPLPSARLISTTIHKDLNIPDPTIALMTCHFGQFLDHDITLTPQIEAQCCGDPFGYSFGSPGSNTNCFDIKIPNNDGFFTTTEPPQQCLNFARSDAFCNQTPREQYNANTAFVDGSNIYGSDENRANNLR